MAVKKKEREDSAMQLAQALDNMSISLDGVVKWQNAMVDRKIAEKATGADILSFYLMMASIYGTDIEQIDEGMIEAASKEVNRVYEMFNKFNAENADKSPKEAEIVEEKPKKKAKK